jgi:predicted DNA repair protein MutK
MPASSLLALIDDIATMLDDVSVMTKVAVKKTAGVLGDDLALNAQQVTGLTTNRELPVVWAVAKGSLVNKAILVPAALAISALLPWAITPLLMIGGAFLCFEGVEKLLHAFWHSQHEDQAHAEELHAALIDPAVDLVALEKDKIKGAVRTDFILSAEIIVISLGTVAGAAFSKQLTVLVAIALIMTVGVYGLVAGIVKLDDLGLYLHQRRGKLQQSLGKFLLLASPWLMKALSFLGTAAMFMVGGGILTHGWHVLHELGDALAHQVAGIGGVGFLLQAIVLHLFDILVGIVVGVVVLAVVTGLKRVLKKEKVHA